MCPVCRMLDDGHSGAVTVTAATGVCHDSGWNKSCIDVQGRFALYYSMAKLGQSPKLAQGLCVRFAGCCSILQTGHITHSSTPDQQL